jgi:hypothetical protein
MQTINPAYPCVYRIFGCQQGNYKRAEHISALPCCIAAWMALRSLASVALSSIQASAVYHPINPFTEDISTLQAIGHFYFALTDEWEKYWIKKAAAPW